MEAMIEIERELLIGGKKLLVGLDEVGRGAWAGPLVAGGVMFGDRVEEVFAKARKLGVRIDDSKKMRPKDRETAAEFIYKNAMAVSIGKVSVAEINRLGMGRSMKRVFARVVNNLGEFDLGLLDGNEIKRVKGLPKRKQMAIVKGDGRVFSIAAASIVAKVYRDDLMGELGKEWKRFGWGRNKGYGTAEHRAAIERWGECRWHRKDYVRTWRLKKGA